jgi:hypothetical protein
MTPVQKQRLRFNSLVPPPISVQGAEKQWAAARRDVLRALKGRNLDAGLRGCVFIEACREADRHIVRSPVGKAIGSAP